VAVSVIISTSISCEMRALMNDGSGFRISSGGWRSPERITEINMSEVIRVNVRVVVLGTCAIICVS